MKAVIQRVKNARVDVENETVGSIGTGLLILLCIEKGDAEEVVTGWAKRIPELRLFSDVEGKMNLSLLDVANSDAAQNTGALVVSQFTLAADLKEKGRRPSFTNAETPDRARALVAKFVEALKSAGVCVAEGKFGASMQVHLQNDGPVTFTI